MNPQEYLRSELTTAAHYTLSDSDTALLAKVGTEEFIYSKLTSKKFRKWKVDDLSEKQVRQAIRLAVAENKPLQFRYPFGGYKLWRMPSSPEVDWAEFFSVAYYCRYLAPIVAVYEPGLELKFASDDMIIERMDNIPTVDTDAYFHSFQKLLGYFRPYFPENMKVDIIRIADLYADKEAMEAELAQNIEKFRTEYQTTVDENKKAKMYQTSELNVRWDGAKDLTTLSDDEKRAVIEMGPVYHDAYCSLSKRRDFNRGDDKIVIFTTPIPNALAVGTTKGTVTKYWTGFGVLQMRESGFAAKILSPTQLADAETGFEVVVKPLPELDLVNFENLRVY